MKNIIILLLFVAHVAALSAEKLPNGEEYIGDVCVWVKEVVQPHITICVYRCEITKETLILSTITGVKKHECELYKKIFPKDLYE